MQVILQPLSSSEGDSIEVETNSKGVLSSLISSYCSQKGIKFESNYTIYDAKKRPLPKYSTLAALGIENGQTLLIGKEDSRFNVLKQWPIIVALATIAIGFIGIITVSLVYGLKGGEYFDDYGVVMDAGSTKTNTIVYKWKSNKYKGTGRVFQQGNCFAPGGIAEMNPLHLEKVIDCAKNVTSLVAPKSVTKTPLFFASTAGMRLLLLTNPSKVNDILKQLAIQLPETNLDVKAIEIISGSDEGIYGWITTNYLFKTLEEPRRTDPWDPTTYGALDLGGASTQIAYALPDDKAEGNKDVSQIQLYGQTHNVLSLSSLCFGRSQAHNRYRSLLLRRRNGTTVTDPCAPKDYVEYATWEEIFEPICANYSIKGEESLNESQLKKVNFTYVGTSDSASCHQRVADLLNDELCTKLNFTECFKKHTGLPDDQKFKAFSGYYYTAKFLNLTKSKTQQLEKYEATMMEFCKKDISEIRELTNDTYGPQYCFNAHYIYHILINGFGFTNKTWKNLEFTGKVGGEDLGWTLGYMTNATKLIPEKESPRLISTTSLTVSLVLFIIVIAGTAIFLLYTCKKSTNGLGSSC